VADRNSPQKHIWRARIILLTAAELGTVEIMRCTARLPLPPDRAFSESPGRLNP